MSVITSPSDKWIKHWLKIAHVTSQLSKDPSTKVGAVVVTPDNRQCSLGYNGFADGIEDLEERWHTRPVKYEYVIHAEENAILNSPFDTKGCTLFCTHRCCHKCMARIIRAGIKRVYYVYDYANINHIDIIDNHAKLLDEIKQVSITL
jgi:dCMP deaminase